MLLPRGDMYAVQVSIEAGVQAMEKSIDLWHTSRLSPNSSSPKRDDREAQFYLCARKYVVLTYREWRASERDFLRRRLVSVVGNHFKQAREVGADERRRESTSRRGLLPHRTHDHLIVMDKTWFRSHSTSVMEGDVFGDGLRSNNG